MLAFDSSLGAAVEFGGYDGALFSNESWKFASGAWNQIVTSKAPPARQSGGMVYDPLGNYTLLFGGYNGSYLNDTWEFHNGAWKEVRPSPSPSPRAWASMAYDPALQRVVLFGGAEGYGQCLNDTWTYSNGSWTNITTNASVSGAPYPRDAAAVAYDGGDGYLLLYGGSNASGVAGNDTWRFENGTWSPVAVTGKPIPLSDAGMAYDPSQQLVEMYGGADQFGGAGTFTYRAGAWAQYYPFPAPAQDGDMGMVYDPSMSAVLVSGGLGGYGNQSYDVVTDTWEVSGTDWTLLEGPNSPGGLDGEAMTYDAADGSVLVFGGEDQCYISCSSFGAFVSDTWSLANGNWTLQRPAGSPNARHAPAMTFDPAANETVLFGGSTFSGAYSVNDTWAYRAGNWTRLHPAASPPARWGANLVYDAATGVLVLFGGTDGSTAFNDTWAFASGTWVELHPSESPSGRAWASASWDAEVGAVLLYGGCQSVSGGFSGCSGSNSNQTWAFANGTWTELPSAFTPPAMNGAGMAAGPADEPVVVFGGGSGVPTWFFQHGRWSGQNLTPGPGYRIYSAMAYDPTDGVYWSFGGLGGTNGALWGLSPPFEVSLRANRTVADVGQTVTFTAAAADGLGTPTFSWSGLPGCPSANLSVLLCPVTTTGQFSVTVTMVTTFGQNATSPPIELVVTADPSIGVPAAVPNPSFVGEPTILSVAVSGGAPPLAVQWFGLPPGCPPANSTTLSCLPTEPGTFETRVVASDAAGLAFYSGFGAVTVAGPPSVAAPLPSRSSVDVGQSVSFTTTLIGSLGAGQLAWTGLPSGCASGNSPTVPCTPTATSNGTVAVRLTYAPGLSVLSNTTSFIVFADPTISVPTASSQVATAGQSVTFSVRTTPGSGNDSIVWSGLPAACAAATLTLACALPSGNFSVSATWTDSNGFAVTSPSAHVQVVPVNPPATPAPNATAPAPNVVPFVLVGLGVAVLGAALALLFLRHRRGGSSRDS